MSEEQELQTVEEKEKSFEEQLKVLVEKRSLKKLKAVIEYLEKVALDDDLTETKMGNMGKDRIPFKVPISHDTRVAAARAWKDMVLDKALSNKKVKETAVKEDELDFKKVLEGIGKELAKQKAKPQAKIIEAKVVPEIPIEPSKD
jgi:riboflavin synthase